MDDAGSVTLVGSGAVIVASASVEDGLRGLLTSAVSVEDCLGAIVAALSAHVRSLPSLVCAIREPEGIRLLLRGTAEALVITEVGEQRIAPGSVSTWAEHMLPCTASLVLRHTRSSSPVILPGSRGADSRVAPVEPAPAIPAPPIASPPGGVLAALDVVQALTSSTLAWLGEAPAAEDGGSVEGAVEPLPPSADAPEHPQEILDEPAAEEPDPLPVAAGPGDAAAATADAAGDANDDDDPFGFRHLLGETMHVSAEDAAVRPLPEDPEDEPVAETPTREQPVTPVEAAPAEPAPAPNPLPVMTGGGLIDSVPGAPSRPEAAYPAAAYPKAGTPGTGLAPARAPASAPPSERGGSPAPGPAAAIPAGSPFASAAARPPVQAVLCDLGHPNPVIASECRLCRHPLLDRTPHTIPRPSLGRLVFSDGMVTDLDSPVLIGRAPAESMAAPDLRETPKLLSLPSQDKRISRLHAEIRLEGWQVYVLDSSSLNGTTVMQPSLPPRQLRSGEPCLVEPGSSVNLGGAVTFAFEGPSSR